jgi:integration host factor subunit beta
MAITVLKPEFLDILHKRLPQHYKQDIALAVDIILDSITEAIAHGQRVEIRGFGSFNATTQSGRTLQNPKTHKTVRYDTCKRIHFQPSPLLSHQRVKSRQSDNSVEKQEDEAQK